MLALFIVFYRHIRDQLLPNLIGFKVMGVELSFVKDSIEAAIQLAEKSPQWKVEVSPLDKERVLTLTKQHLKNFREAQMLWVDDHPENNLNERRMFHQLKAEIDIAKSTEATAGLTFLKRSRNENQITPVIFYVGVFEPEKGAPAHAFDITNRPDELLHLTLDALEREKY